MKICLYYYGNLWYISMINSSKCKLPCWTHELYRFALKIAVTRISAANIYSIYHSYKCHYFFTLHKFVDFNVIEFKRYDLYVIRRLKDFPRTAYNVKYRQISSREWRVISTFAFFFSFLFLFFLWSFMRSMSSGVLERLRILSRLKPTKVLTWRGFEDYIDIYLPSRRLIELAAQDDEENLRVRKKQEQVRAEKRKRNAREAISSYVALLSEMYNIARDIYR